MLVGNRASALAGMAAAAYKESDGFEKATRMTGSAIFVNRNGKREGEGQVQHPANDCSTYTGHLAGTYQSMFLLLNTKNCSR
jgi:hypothetical protein